MIEWIKDSDVFVNKRLERVMVDGAMKAEEARG
jgi:hypothetical protein